MKPARAKHEWEVNGLLEKLTKHVHHLEGIAPSAAVLPIMFKVQAIINTLCGKLSDLHDTVSNHKIKSESELRFFIQSLRAFRLALFSWFGGSGVLFCLVCLVGLVGLVCFLFCFLKCKRVQCGCFFSLFCVFSLIFGAWRSLVR